MDLLARSNIQLLRKFWWTHIHWFYFDQSTKLISTSSPNNIVTDINTEIVLSGILLLLLIVFKIDFQKLPPKIVNYRDYKKFGNENFSLDISKFEFGTSDLEGFKNTIFCSFNKHAPTKGKYLRVNEASYVIKEVCKVTLKRYKLRNKLLK